MSEKIGNYINLVVCLLASTLAILVKTAAAPCQKLLACAVNAKVHMCCYYSGQAIFLTSLLIVVLALENFLRKQRTPVVYIGAMLVLILLLNKSIGIGICVAGMACSKMKAVTIVFALLIGVFGILELFVKGKKEL